MYFLMTYSIHLYLWLYAVRHMVNDYTDNESRTTVPPFHELLFSITCNCTMGSVAQTG